VRSLASGAGSDYRAANVESTQKGERMISVQAGVRVAVVLMTGLTVAAGTAAAQSAAPAVEAQGQSLQRYEIDTGHSHVGFVVRHLGVANVRGNFTRFTGHVMIDENDLTNSSVSVTIDAGSIDTSHERRDNDLRSEDFFDVERFPNVTFTSTRVEQTADGLVMVGNLTMRDVTREVRIPFEVTGPVELQGRKRVGAEGTLRINRFDYGLQWNRLQEAIPVVGDEVRIELNIEAITPRPE
jgi:polyisoprenoid-binding protein YceI